MQESLIDGLSAMVGGDLRMPKMAMSKTNWWIGLVCQRILACELLHVCVPAWHPHFLCISFQYVAKPQLSVNCGVCYGACGL